jgi:hypothetical protein
VAVGVVIVAVVVVGLLMFTNGREPTSPDHATAPATPSQATAPANEPPSKTPAQKVDETGPGPTK